MTGVRMAMLAGAALCLLMAFGALLAAVRAKEAWHRRLLQVLAATGLLWGAATALFAWEFIPGIAFLALFVLLQAPLFWIWKQSARARGAK